MSAPDVDTGISPQTARVHEQGDSAASDNNLQKFDCFPRLATELRLKIWKYALPNGVDDDGERILSLKIHIVSGDPVNGVKINFSVFNRESESHAWMDYPGKQSPSEQVEEHHNRSIKDLKNVTLLATCVESRGVVLKISKNTLPMIKDSLLRYDDETVICIPNWSFSSTADPIQRALSANCPMPSFPIRSFFTAPIPWWLSMGTGSKDATNLSLFEGLKCVKFSAKHLRQVVFQSLDSDKREEWIQAYLQFVLEYMRQQKKIDPEYNVPKVGLWGKKINGHREMQWASPLEDEKDILDSMLQHAYGR
jgi:hypothetical protein